MSKEHAKKFIEHMQKDPVLRKKVQDAADHIVKVAKDHGYEVTREEIGSELKERWKGDEADEAANGFSETPAF
jgi:predicted ribosomally synthesized peptide with nif11-like leader